MRVEAKAEQPMSAEALRKRSGRDWAEWYTLLDAAGGPSAGRRTLTEFLMKEHALDAWWAQTIVVEYEAARSVHEKDGRPKGYAICITKTIAVPAEAVFDAFATSQALQPWLGAGCVSDFREGGSFTNSDGNRGSYLKISRPKRVRFSWDDEEPGLASTVEVLLTPKGQKCGLVLNHERIQTRPLADGLRAAWGAAIDRLKSHLEK